ncbi:type IV secretion system protein [Pseudodesulfovibrio indicus]|uniref:type IV secretion system protein n=1 Tax=Pseudodesulfovibrio indicus TaxID=1716143 RepID=UPI00292D5859|nr:type IV secretion system protein [Pseudodesulfovibrio indicus]
MTISANIYYSTCMSLSRFYLSMYGDLMDSFSIFLRAAFTLYIVHVAYQFALNKKEGKDSQDIIITSLLVSTVYVFAFETSGYYNYVIKPTFALLEDILTFILSKVQEASSYLGKPAETDYFSDVTNITQLFTALDMMFLEFMKTCKGLLPSGWKMFNPLLLVDVFAILMLILAYGAMYCCFVFMFIMSYFLMWLLFYVGGIVLILGCFKETRGIFFSWAKMLFNYALVAIFTALVVAVCYAGISQSVYKMTTYDTTMLNFTADFLGLFVWCFICFAITLKTPDLAAGLTNTMAGSTSGIAGALSMGGGKAAAMSAGLGTMHGKGIGALATKAGQMSGVVPSGMSATQRLKDRLGIKN